MPLLAFKLWPLWFNNRHHFSPEESVSGHKPKLSGRFDCLVVPGVLDSVNFCAQVADALLRSFESTTVPLESLLSVNFIVFSLFLWDLVSPSWINNLLNFTLLQMWHLIADGVELLVKKCLIRTQWQFRFRSFRLRDQSFQLGNFTPLVIRKIAVCVGFRLRSLCDLALPVPSHYVIILPSVRSFPVAIELKLLGFCLDPFGNAPLTCLQTFRSSWFDCSLLVA